MNCPNLSAASASASASAAGKGHHSPPESDKTAKWETQLVQKGVNFFISRYKISGGGIDKNYVLSKAVDTILQGEHG